MIGYEARLEMGGECKWVDVHPAEPQDSRAAVELYRMFSVCWVRTTRFDEERPGWVMCR